MGAAIATHLIEEGHTVAIWNRTLSRAEAFKDRAVVAARPADAVAHADLVIVSMLDNGAARSTLEAAERALLIPIVVNLVDAPATARALSEWAQERGVRYISGVMRDAVHNRWRAWVKHPRPRERARTSTKHSQL